MTDKIDIITVYETFRTLENYSEQARWNRLNVCVIVNSILFLSWANLYSMKHDKPNCVLVIICLIGIILGFIWRILGERSNEYQDKMHRGAKAIEDNADYYNQAYPKPYTGIDDTRKPLEKAEFDYHKYGTSTFIVKNIPMMFAILFFFLLFYSC